MVDDVPLWRAYTGQARAAVRGHGWLDAVHPDERARTLQVWTHAIATATLYETEHRLQRADGTYRPFLARAAPIRDEAGGVREWVGVCTDLADRYHSESPPSSQASELLLGATKPVRANPWKMAGKNHGDDGQKGLDEQNHRTLHRNN